MPHLFLSAAHKSSGKTTVTLGLCAALRQRGLTVQPFKKGPDYIDPMWLTHASGRACRNLDFFTTTDEEILQTVRHYGSDADISLIEGNKGLYDGLDVEGTNSNAALAKLLCSPVILVLDVRGTIRGVAPLLIGYREFDHKVNIAGVILNQLGGPRHESKLRAVIEHYTSFPVLGAIGRAPELELVERHLGLMPSNEDAQAGSRIAKIADVIAQQVDLERILEIAANAQFPTTTEDHLPIPLTPILTTPISAANSKIKLGIARDAAFGFYYPDDLEALEKSGAELIPINTLQDTHLPEIDGLFIGGGFPETQMQALEANVNLRHELRAAIEGGLPTYAECGGLMYLSRSLSWKGRRCDMVGVIQADTVVRDRPAGRGYIQLQETGKSLWPKVQSVANEIAAHEFHYSTLENLAPETRYAYRMLRGAGIDGQHDGIIYKNLLACYAHLRHTAQNPWTERFIQFIYSYKQNLAH